MGRRLFKLCVYMANLRYHRPTKINTSGYSIKFNGTTTQKHQQIVPQCLHQLVSPNPPFSCAQELSCKPMPSSKIVEFSSKSADIKTGEEAGHSGIEEWHSKTLRNRPSLVQYIYIYTYNINGCFTNVGLKNLLR